MCRDVATAENTLSLVLSMVKGLEEAGIKTWLFGGWAEELWGLRPPGQHRDIDLLYPVEDLEALDNFLRTRRDVEEVWQKRFPHKRAFQWQGVLVEVFLVRREAAGSVTDFFGTHRFPWPPDTLSRTLRLPDGERRAASPAALLLYRERHGDVEQAYRRHVARGGR